MADQSTAKGSDSENSPTLPELNEAVVDLAFLEQYLEDLTRCVELLGVLPKMAAQQRVDPDAVWTLAEARQALSSGRVRGVQIRYRYQGAEWWDTLLVHPQGVRIVRIRHEFR